MGAACARTCLPIPRRRMLRPGAHLSADGLTGFSRGSGCLVWTWPGLSPQCPRRALVDGSGLFLSVRWTLPCHCPLPTVRSACAWLHRGHAFEAAGCGESARPWGGCGLRLFCCPRVRRGAGRASCARASAGGATLPSSLVTEDV